ncbi:hypothetical protein BSPLISOX_51 [uncultured Gammaproteobacteria bacterium]|jgi:hypothetical protein|nr:hypothetical protein [uncultured Gammaproteobacteria bacterium]VVH66415.1 hypothetical protein BSPLISOX_51 [uncultured Gammaproteobacteria bacterium]
MNLIFGLIAFILAILAIFMPEFGVWTTLYSVMFAVFAIGWGFWLGIIAIVVNLTNLLIFSSDMFIRPGFAIFAVSLILVQIIGLVVLVKHNKRRSKAFIKDSK